MNDSRRVSLKEYTRTTYRPDRDYLEGEARMRHMGERSHAVLHAAFVWKLGQLERLSAVHVLSSARVQVRQDRIRVPDVCLIPRSAPRERVLRLPPLLCVEVFSSNESVASMAERAGDYAAMGVEHIWAADPWSRRGYTWGRGELREVAGDVLRIDGTPIRVNLAAMFARLDG